MHNLAILVVLAKRMNTRKIAYIEPKEDILQKEVDWAMQSTLEQKLEVFCNHIRTTYSLAGVDVQEYSAKKIIYYISDNES